MKWDDLIVDLETSETEDRRTPVVSRGVLYALEDGTILLHDFCCYFLVEFRYQVKVFSTAASRGTVAFHRSSSIALLVSNVTFFCFQTN